MIHLHKINKTICSLMESNSVESQNFPRLKTLVSCMFLALVLVMVSYKRILLVRIKIQIATDSIRPKSLSKTVLIEDSRKASHRNLHSYNPTTINTTTTSLKNSTPSSKKVLTSATSSKEYKPKQPSTYKNVTRSNKS
jgi:hypothetical protein